MLVERNLVDHHLIQPIDSPRLFLADVKHSLLVLSSLLIDGESNDFDVIDNIFGLYSDNVANLHNLWVFSQMCQHYF